MKDLLHINRLILALIFATIFMVVGQGVPDLYFRYFDRTEYFKVEQPVKINKETFQPGEKITVTIVRTVQYPANVSGVVELILVNNNGDLTKRTLTTANFNIDKSSEQVIHTTYTLPTDLVDGSYYIKAVLTYRIRGFEKTYVWQTKSFLVEKNSTKE